MGKFKDWWKDKVADNFSLETRDKSEGMGRFLNGVDNWWNRVTGSGLTDAEREANKYSAAQAEAQYNREVEFYEKYQSPKAMMQQGVNPFGINGSPGGHTASGGSPTSVTPQGAEGLGGMMSLVQSIFGMVQQKRSVDSQVALNKSAEDRNYSEANERNINAASLADMNAAEIVQRLSNVELNIENVKLIASKVVNTDQDTVLKAQQIEKLVAEIDNTEADTELKGLQLSQIVAEIANIEADTEVKQTQVSALLAQIARDSKSLDVMESQIALMASQVGVNEAEVSLVFQQIANLEQEYDFNEVLKGFEEMAAGRELGADNFYNSKLLPTIKRTVDSVLGWWSGSSTVELPQRKPARIGYK